MTRFLLPLAGLGMLALSLFAGCGGAAAPATPSTPSFSVGDVSTPEGAVAAVDQAERAIDQLLGPSQSMVISQQAGAAQMAPAGAPAAPPPPPAPSAAPESLPRDAAKTDTYKSKKAEVPAAAPLADTCTTACSALASMERATDHLCSLAGAADNRCTNARARAKVAHDRVHASCPACG